MPLTEHLLQLGPEAHEFLTELVHRRPKWWVADVERLHEALQHYGEDRLRGALRSAIEQNLYGGEYVLHILLSTTTREAS